MSDVHYKVCDLCGARINTKLGVPVNGRDKAHVDLTDLRGCGVVDLCALCHERISKMVAACFSQKETEK